MFILQFSIRKKNDFFIFHFTNRYFNFNNSQIINGYMYNFFCFQIIYYLLLKSMKNATGPHYY